MSVDYCSLGRMISSLQGGARVTPTRIKRSIHVHGVDETIGYEDTVGTILAQASSQFMDGGG
jgi:hypothetical protein